MVVVDSELVIGADKEMLEGIAGHKEVHSDEEYRQFVKNHPLPDGYTWGRSPFGASAGGWRIHLKEKPEIRGKNTDLERKLGGFLENWGYRERFKHDFRYIGYQLDFADPVNKVALEPGAAYWHTPESVAGGTKIGVGESPSEVYSPPTTKDVKKHNSLVADGWQVLWINEDGFNGEEETIRQWLVEVYE